MAEARPAEPPTIVLPDLGQRTHVMGILNVTPDSFSDGGRFFDSAQAVAHALEIEREGADIVDIGGESTRPGAAEVDPEEEIRRVIPIVEAVTPRLAIPISVDTYKAATARQALEAGARMINDVWGLQRDPDMACVAAAYDATVVVMHNRREVDPALDIVDDMRAFFDRSIGLARRAGLPDRHIVLDPGIGFGKSWEQNLAALRRLPEIKALGFPVLVGASRKSWLQRFCDLPRQPAERLFGTLGAHLAAVALGADIVRVHDVRAHVEATRVADAVGRAPR